MKSIRKFILVTASVLVASAAHAQFGGLGGFGGGGGGGGGGDISADVTSFVTKSRSLSELASRSMTAINAAFSSESDIAAKRAALEAIDKITDPAEKEAKKAAVYESESAEAKRRLESGEMEKAISGLSDAKKKQVSAAILNFGIGALQAVDLAKTGQGIVQKASANPMSIPKVVPVKDALPLLSKIASDAGGFFVGVIKLAKGANISIPEVTASSKPVDSGDFK
jgi:hypothetical protein